MNPVPATVKAPALPQVNLLPPEVGERRTRSRLMRIAGVFVVVFIIFLAAGFLLVDNLRRSAEDELAYEQQKMTALNTEIAQYRFVQDLKAELTAAEEARGFVGNTDVVRAEVASYLLGAMPEGTVLTEYTMGITTFENAAGDSNAAFARPGVGTITFTANSPTFMAANDVELLLESYAAFSQVRVVGVSNVALEGAEEGEEAAGYDLTGTIQVTYDVFTERFSDSWYGTDEEPGTQDYYAGLLAAARGVR